MQLSSYDQNRFTFRWHCIDWWYCRWKNIIEAHTQPMCNTHQSHHTILGYTWRSSTQTHACSMEGTQSNPPLNTSLSPSLSHRGGSWLPVRWAIAASLWPGTPAYRLSRNEPQDHQRPSGTTAHLPGPQQPCQRSLPDWYRQQLVITLTPKPNPKIITLTLNTEP